jgi:quercetin dioxygenase-like cupin family protein
MRIFLIITLVAATAFAAPPPNAIQVEAAKIVWKEASPALPHGTRIAVLEGDPTKEGTFTIRLRVPAGGHIGPHWHPRPERVTVLSGKVRVGFGETWNDKEMRTFNPGDFYVNPAEARHFVDFPLATIVQITSEGPWEINPVK